MTKWLWPWSCLVCKFYNTVLNDTTVPFFLSFSTQDTGYWDCCFLLTIYYCSTQSFLSNPYISVATHPLMTVPHSYTRSDTSQSMRLTVDMQGTPSAGSTAGFNALACNHIVYTTLFLSTIHEPDTSESACRHSIKSSVGYCHLEEPFPSLVVQEQQHA